MVFDIKPGKEGQARKVAIKIPVMGAYRKTFPLACTKSNQIIRQAAGFYAGKDRLKAHGFFNALACLFLLSTGDNQYISRVKEYFSQFLAGDGRVQGIVEMTWDNGYNGIACAEYYLRTGDKSVLPILQHCCDDARNRQYWNKGWTHWGHDCAQNSTRLKGLSSSGTDTPVSLTYSPHDAAECVSWSFPASQ